MSSSHCRSSTSAETLHRNADTSATSTGAITGHDDAFTLYDLRVEAVCPPGQRILCGAKDGDHFTLEGEMMYLPPGQGISIYSLASILPLLAAKQRPSARNDWMSTDAEIACPDPHCPSRWRIVRTGLRTFKHGDVTAVPLEPIAGREA
ncbi:hypothetical protein PsYK624_166880 [Phanerochaete sordida]|uniref:TIGR04076 family protein n=1 Tax=Phanerochaete sordida TaxID=48140 RepID=A0A9P3GX90_9APHY|nr:hypothetical protein PsYK624_166880 [Phanerochaete sordida]